MSKKQTNPTVIGAFVVGAFAIAMGALLLFGGSRFFSESRRAVIYFRESVAGLNVGAPVNFSGVTVGVVENIELVFNMENQSVQIPVIIQIFPERLAVTGGSPEELYAKTLIEQGLRAQLGLSSFITQQLVINLVEAPNSRVRLIEADADTFRTADGLVEIPAIPSQMQELKSAIEKVVKNLAELNINKVLQQLQETVAGISELVSQANVQDFLASTQETLSATQRLIEDINRQIGPLLASAENALNAVEGAASAGEQTLKEAQTVFADAGNALATAQGALRRLERTVTAAGNVIEPGSPLYGQAMAALKEATNAARSLRNLANQLERNPNSILFGRRQ